jgi:hypothetical protein
VACMEELRFHFTYRSDSVNNAKSKQKGQGVTSDWSPAQPGDVGSQA